MDNAGKPRFKPNWLTWPVAREGRPFRVYVVEPREYSPKDHASIFLAAVELFLSPQPEKLRRDFPDQRYDRPPPRPEFFDLLTFPEAFLPSDTLLDFLSFVGNRLIPLGCLHAGLRPPGQAADGTHLFTAWELGQLVEAMKRVPTLHGEDLQQFSAWREEQGPDDRFNVGCLFTVDAEQRLRVCLHPKLVRSRFEESPFRDKHMKEANLLSLVTLKPTDKKLSHITIQPLICSDVLKLDTDNPNNHPLEAITEHRSCFPEVMSDHVDVVSVVTCSPNKVQPSTSIASHRAEWHQEFRKCFERAASEDQCLRHHQAAFVLTNFGLMPPSPTKAPGGLSGVFLPLPVYSAPYDAPWVSKRKAIYGRFPPDDDEKEELEEERWIRGDAEGQKQGGKSGLGYIVSLDPSVCRHDALATMFGFTVHRLPRDANRWKKKGGVLDFSLYDAFASKDAEEPRPQFKPRADS